ncbi:uncharacterized protein MONOS_11385 [Monocercomonoides exilis]|uniref:uncharacterized protein n=1 Tax=Monocercomonoides exilis TaxID=2049356 RepID=UPI0035597378|nr:hypothetical protein MONOS_11385 [Monocercomonoides exilis]|eukprot:MONOS_11385.1-p1 / transcript=MONOS_11385.1 / gene=MONOS_11385 / organism=Monocercomonoides_exilis_PA203 / gene_product=unspecified product / transcript_product=unspecified product / location=Mono_scaffold00568:30271-31167(-) / protein_length=254 / sequence_SO=supercontig / SO=protein_coding / is_pseudo=false
MSFDDTTGVPSPGSFEQPSYEMMDEGLSDEAFDKPKLTEAQINELTATYKLFIKKKEPNFITIDDAITALRSLGYIFLAGDVHNVNAELNHGSPQVNEEMFIQIASSIQFADEEEINESFQLLPKEDGAPENVDKAALRTLLMSEGEKLTVAEYDLLMREIMPPPPEEDPKKKKKKGGRATSSSPTRPKTGSSTSSGMRGKSATGKKKKGKKGEELEEEEPDIKLTFARCVEFMQKKVIEEELPALIQTKRKR